MSRKRPNQLGNAEEALDRLLVLSQGDLVSKHKLLIAEISALDFQVEQARQLVETTKEQAQSEVERVTQEATLQIQRAQQEAAAQIQLAQQEAAAQIQRVQQEAASQTETARAEIEKLQRDITEVNLVKKEAEDASRLANAEKGNVVREVAVAYAARDAAVLETQAAQTASAQANAARDAAVLETQAARRASEDANRERNAALTEFRKADAAKLVAQTAADDCAKNLADLQARLRQGDEQVNKLGEDMYGLKNVRDSLMVQITNTVRLLTTWPTTDPRTTGPIIDKLLFYAPTTLWRDNVFGPEQKLRTFPPIRDIVDSIQTELETVEELREIAAKPVVGGAGGAGGAGADVSSEEAAMLAALDAYQGRLEEFKGSVTRQARKLQASLVTPYPNNDIHTQKPQGRRDAIWLYYRSVHFADEAISEEVKTFLKRVHDIPDTLGVDALERAGARRDVAEEENDGPESDSDSTDDSDGDLQPPGVPVAPQQGAAVAFVPMPPAPTNQRNRGALKAKARDRSGTSDGKDKVVAEVTPKKRK